jgi:hypothetical protein
MAQYLISISPDGQWGADWEKRRCTNGSEYKPYQGFDQLNALFNITFNLNSNEFLEIVKSKIKELIISSDYRFVYEEKLKLLDGENNFVVVDDVGPHGTKSYKKSIELINCDEFAHIDEINDCNTIDDIKAMHRLYMCPKGLSESTFINHNFPTKQRTINIV